MKLGETSSVGTGKKHEITRYMKLGDMKLGETDCICFLSVPCSYGFMDPQTSNLCAREGRRWWWWNRLDWDH